MSGKNKSVFFERIEGECLKTILMYLPKSFRYTVAPRICISFCRYLCRFYYHKKLDHEEINQLFQMKDGVTCDLLMFTILRGKLSLHNLTFEYYGYPYGVMELCSSKGLFYSVRYLLMKQDPRSRDQNCFFEACQQGRARIVDLLIKDGRIDPCFQHFRGFLYACKNGHASVAKRLLEEDRIHPKVLSNFAFEVACENGRESVFNLLCETEPRVKLNFQCLKAACQSGSLGIVRSLLKRREIDPCENENEAVRIASENGHDEVVKEFLMDGRIDPSLNRNDLIVWASFYGQIRVVRILMEDRRVDPSDHDNYAFKFAKGKGYNLLCQLLKKDQRVLDKIFSDSLEEKSKKSSSPEQLGSNRRSEEFWKEERGRILEKLENDSGDLFSSSLEEEEDSYKETSTLANKSNNNRRRWRSAVHHPLEKSITSPQNIMGRRRVNSSSAARKRKWSKKSDTTGRRYSALHELRTRSTSSSSSCSGKSISELRKYIHRKSTGAAREEKKRIQKRPPPKIMFGPRSQSFGEF